MVYQQMLNTNVQDESMRQGFLNTAALIFKSPPSVTWLLLVLSTIEPNHAIFAKDYVKPKVVRQGQAVGVVVPNIDDFFTGLPAMARKKGKAGISFVSKAQKEAERTERLERQAAEI